MPNAALESMACGLPSIITEFQGMHKVEFAQPSREFLLAARTEEALAAEMNRMLGETDYAQQIGKNAHAWTSAQLDFKTTIQSYAEVFHRVAHGG